ncbi:MULTISPECIES: GFA family protein [unclassified Massilia]|uniref:GFA family protein n=1 Tax=unclassified Massilia TaxID=2609279 RepID=UPI001781E802|nr:MULTISPECIES: GFA family protein [unclassified Massilia]MBD8530323.1 GFA family protein [Massilia sp. CFBP 13647]MBD8673100.1 GFA family protein [Massilia sp. CFBP 13721]
MLQGGCFCGAVRYVVDGEPFNSTLCHCSDCRRSAGAPAVAWFSARMEQVRFTKGNPATYRSSEQVLRGFCAACGTTLSYQDGRQPDEIDIATASLDDPEAAAPRDHTFAGERLSWMHSGDGLPAYPRTRSEGGG